MIRRITGPGLPTTIEPVTVPNIGVRLRIQRGTRHLDIPAGVATQVADALVDLAEEVGRCA